MIVNVDNAVVKTLVFDSSDRSLYIVGNFIGSCRHVARYRVDDETSPSYECLDDVRNEVGLSEINSNAVVMTKFGLMIGGKVRSLPSERSERGVRTPVRAPWDPLNTRRGNNRANCERFECSFPLLLVRGADK